MVREFEGQLLNLQLAPLEFGVALGELVLQCKNLRQGLFLSWEIDAIPCRRNAQIHEPDYTTQEAYKPCKHWLYEHN